MTAVLGIDAAWTLTAASGVALAAKGSDGWRLIAAADSYKRFYALLGTSQAAPARRNGSKPDVAKLLSTAAELCNSTIDLIAIDIPLARGRIVGRRVSDNAVSRAYGGRKCGTHSPSIYRPGQISEDLREDLGLAGYPLCTNTVAIPGAIEVYPHPALLELAGARERLPYKVSRARSYWPLSTSAERRQRLIAEWTKIVDLLEQQIGGVKAALPSPNVDAAAMDLKAFEDLLDAVVCAWIGISTLEGRSTAFGDHESAIWIPTAKSANRRLATTD